MQLHVIVFVSVLVLVRPGQSAMCQTKFDDYVL